MQEFLVMYDQQTLSIINKSMDVVSLEKNNILLILCTNSQKYTVKTLLLAYQREGISFLKKIEDAFSLLIYDKIEDKIFLAKDKMGIYPLYYTDNNGTILISTHLKKFQSLSNVELKINTNAVANYLQYGLILQPNTIFKNFYKVKSGNYISFNLKTKKNITQTYWSLEECYLMPKSLFNEQKIIQNAHNLLQESLNSTMNKDSKAGFSLSGGYDSSTLVAIAQTNSEEKINTFTIGFEEQMMNEAPDAQKIANYLGTDHTEYYFTAKDALTTIPKIAQIYDEPFADHATAPTILTGQLLKEKNIDTLISGDGGDEVFATADELKSFELLERTPKFIKKIMVATLLKVPITKPLKHKQNKLSQILMADNISKSIKVRKGLFLENELSLYIKNTPATILTSFDDINFTKNAETLDQIIGTYFKTTMTDGELVKSYQSMRSINIHLSTPFLDTNLIEYLAKVPSSIKVKAHVKKYLLKEIAHQYLPKSLMERPKSGFNVPFSSWMRNELKDLVYNHINKKTLDEDNIFYSSSILNIRDEFYAGNDEYKYKLWRIFIFQLWYKNFKK